MYEEWWLEKQHLHIEIIIRKKREAPLKPSLQGGQNDLIQFLKLN